MRNDTLRAIAALSLLLVAGAVSAQTAPAVTFGASVTSADGALSTRLTWSTAPAASGCTAAGHPSWTGAKPASGTLDLPAITLSGTYQLSLTCTWPADSTARLTWSAPTKNTDGSTLTNLAGFKVYYGASAAALTNERSVPGANTTSYTVTGLTAGTWHFGIKSSNSAGVDSAMSNVVSKVISGAQQVSQAVTLTVNPIPEAPGDLTIQ